MLNRVMLIGRLGKDPEVRHTSSGKVVANFSLATTGRKDQNGEPHTEWHSIVTFDRQAEIAQQYLQKGSLIFVEGRIQTQEWEGRDGQKRTSVEIIANNFRMLHKAKNADEL